MKFHLTLKSSAKWIGGMTCRKANRDSSLEELRPLAAMWKDTIIATRIDRRSKDVFLVSETSVAPSTAKEYNKK